MYALGVAMIEDEVIHWWRDEEGVQHRTILRLESEEAQLAGDFPRDGRVVVRIVNTVGSQAIKLSPEEALRVSTQMLSIAKELLNQKRNLWKRSLDAP